MKKTILFLFFSVLFFSCGEEKKVIVPEGIIDKQKMALIIADIHVAEAEAGLRTTQDTIAFLGFAAIFEKHETDTASYGKSLTFYISHPELFNEIYQEALNELSKRQAEAAKE